MTSWGAKELGPLGSRGKGRHKWNLNTEQGKDHKWKDGGLKRLMAYSVSLSLGILKVRMS